MNDKEKSVLKSKCLTILRKKLSKCYQKDQRAWFLNENAMWYAATIVADMCVRATYADIDKAK